VGVAKSMVAVGGGRGDVGGFGGSCVLRRGSYSTLSLL
jgi:hypothetical protein